MSQPLRIPFNQLHWQQQALGPALQAAMQRVLHSGQYLKGTETAAFEQAWSAYLQEGAGPGQPPLHTVGCGNGTDALEIILRALQIGPGHEVVVPPNSWVSTAAAVVLVGATPVFAEVEMDSANLDPASVERLIGPATRAIIAVHLYGRMANMPALAAVARQYDLHLIEDAAQAHGAWWGGEEAQPAQPTQPVQPSVAPQTAGPRAGHTAAHGSVAAAFSFYPIKNLGALGDAGAIVTHLPELAQACRRLGHQGQLQQQHEHPFVARTSRIDELQAALLQAKLPHLNQWNARRSTLAQQYAQGLQNTPLVLPTLVPGHAWHLYVVLVPPPYNRQELQDYLTAQGIGTAQHYPALIPHTPAYKAYAHPGEGRVVAVQRVQQHLSLPLHPGLTNAEQQEVIAAIRNYFAIKR